MRLELAGGGRFWTGSVYASDPSFIKTFNQQARALQGHEKQSLAALEAPFS
ncbi:MAG: hypothetical protein RMN51_09770 [Verrucomicrobiota bacterium]|nr:hypothetical protein [Limisphaera sp.]MDW8382378.1 hypothetical protein [Verrucomicrobiota bacterium]